MTIKEFIEAAIEGGWNNKIFWFTQEKDSIIMNATISDLERMCLDPEAWKAVGKVKGWKKLQVPDLESKEYEIAEEWQYHMYMMISALIYGRTLESYIETL